MHQLLSLHLNEITTNSLVSVVDVEISIRAQSEMREELTAVDVGWFEPVS